MFQPIDTIHGETTIYVNGREVRAYLGEPVAAVLLRTPPFAARTTPVRGEARAPYCMMGICFDCLAVVDGEPSVQTCRTPVRAGMRVELQAGAARIGHA